MVNAKTGLPTNLPIYESGGELVPCAPIWSIGRTSGSLSIQKANLSTSRVANPAADRQFRKDDTTLKWGMAKEPVRAIKK